MKLRAAVLLLVIVIPRAEAANDRHESVRSLPRPTAAQRAQQEKLLREIGALEQQLEIGGTEFEEEQRAWEADMARPIAWQPLMPVDVKVPAGKKITVETDGTLVMTGRGTKAIALAITARTALRGITAFRIELLPDGAASRNVVINELRISARGRGGKRVPVPLREASSDVESGDRDIARIIDGKTETGWRCHAAGSEPHFIVVRAAAPVGVTGNSETELFFDIAQNHRGDGTLHRVKLSATATASPVRALSRALRAILAIEPTERSDAQRQQLRDYFHPLSESVRKVEGRIAEKKAALAKVVASGRE
jgi:hypothetical protein